VSRYYSLVDAQAAVKVFGIPMPVSGVTVAHGYDRPCYAYFCDVEPDCEVGIYYGMIGLTKQLSRTEYLEAMNELGLDKAALAVALDLPY